MNIDEIVKTLLNCPKNKLIFLYIYQNKRQNAEQIIKEYVECNNSDINEIIDTYYKQYNNIAQNSSNNQIAQEWLNKPKCPTCNSTNIQKIGTLNRMASVGFLGLASNKIGKTYKCNNCGCTW